jgi:hypothetical protein
LVGSYLRSRLQETGGNRSFVFGSIVFGSIKTSTADNNSEQPASYTQSFGASSHKLNVAESNGRNVGYSYYNPRTGRFLTADKYEGEEFGTCDCATHACGEYASPLPLHGS